MKWIVMALLVANLGVLIWKTSVVEPAPQSMSTPTPRSDSGANLPLLSEVDAASLRARIDRQAVTTAVANAEPTALGDEDGPANAPAASPGTLLCYSAGPFKSGGSLRDRVRTWLRGRVSRVRLRQDERREVALYWVHFPPAASRDDANARLAELKAKGITDVQVVPKGDMANAVSLGVFSKTSSRDRRLREMKKHGYEPQVSNRYRTVKADWLDVAIEPELNFDTEEFAKAFPGVDLDSQPCTPG